MGNFVREFFNIETIEHPKLNTLNEILEILQDDYLNLLAKNYNLDGTIQRNKLIDSLKFAILTQFRSKIINFSAAEHKSFNEFYQGAVDYSDENVYVNLKNFTGLGILFLFTVNEGQLYSFKIPDEIITIYEELLQSV
ncbi:hypothetical protein [Peptoniphilus mikwangii]|uniref:hypothetical protein n=1 Tax=Peptoniphilus mikwangii TaxID=1354300 RepID=UPI00040296B3|nr:hypothetical protein [Peptoniphilus mikwangii]